MKVKLCRECKHSMPEPNFEWNLRCMHPIVNSKDSWALAGTKPHGSCAREERSIKWFAPCGMRGSLWEPKMEEGSV
jgi:hypothetical protein